MRPRNLYNFLKVYNIKPLSGTVLLWILNSRPWQICSLILWISSCFFLARNTTQFSTLIPFYKPLSPYRILYPAFHFHSEDYFLVRKMLSYFVGGDLEVDTKFPRRIFVCLRVYLGCLRILFQTPSLTTYKLQCLSFLYYVYFSEVTWFKRSCLYWIGVVLTILTVCTLLTHLTSLKVLMNLLRLSKIYNLLTLYIP